MANFQKDRVSESGKQLRLHTSKLIDTLSHGPVSSVSFRYSGIGGIAFLQLFQLLQLLLLFSSYSYSY